MADSPLILLTGVTGYIGGNLVPRLMEKRYRVRMLVRDPSRLLGRAWLGQVEMVTGDILSEEILLQAMRGVHAAYYFIHNMSSGRNYHQREIDSARNFADAAAANGVEHIIYLGGLADPGKEIGKHLLSRIQTGEALREGSVPVTEFRASLIIGSGSISFELIRYLSEQLPVVLGPEWMSRHTQPIAIQNVLDYLVAALEDPASRGKIYEIGGKDVLTYVETIAIYARLRGLKRPTVRLPGLPVPLMAWMAGRLTPVPARIAGPLLGSMRAESTVRDQAAARDFPQIQPIGYEAAVKLALQDRTPDCLESAWENEISSFKIRQSGFFVEGQKIHLNVHPGAAYQAVTDLGGKAGWLYLNGLWQLRGTLDRLAGGPGLRGRPDRRELAVGDVIDYYRVEILEPGRMVRLRAELKAPGLGWMEWRILPQPDGGVSLTQIAYFSPNGTVGFLYWYILLPVHRRVFSGLIKALARRAVEINRNL